MLAAAYRITAPTMVVFAKNTRQHAETIGAGSIITLVDPADVAKDGLIEVRFLDRTVWMFAQDIRARGIKVKPVHSEDRGGESRSATSRD